MYVEQRPHDADDDEEEENTDSLVSTVLEALEKLDEHLQESNGDVSLWYQPQRACELFYAQHYVRVKRFFLQVLPGTVLDEVQHLCVPPEVIHQLLERDMLLSAEEHLELYDSPIVLDLDAGERSYTPPPHPDHSSGRCSLCWIKNEVHCWSASLNRNGTPQPL